MEYLEFTSDGDPKVSGIRNGTSQAWFDDDFWITNKELNDFMWNNDRHDLRYISGVLPEFNMDLKGVFLAKSAKLTDLIQVGSLLTGMVISPKFRSLLEKFHLPKHKYFEVSFDVVNSKKEKIKEVNDYWWLYFERETGECTVDFANSTFDTSFHTEYLHLDEADLKVNSYEDYMKVFYERGTALRASKVIFNTQFDCQLDLWGTRFLSVKDYVSDKLVKSIEENNITGYRAIPAERAREIARRFKKVYSELIFF